MTSQAAGFGNMQNASRSIAPFGGGPPAGPAPAFPGLYAPPQVYGPMGQMGSFAPGSPGVGAGFGGAGFGGVGAGSFPGMGAQQAGMAIGGGEALAAGLPGPFGGAVGGFVMGGVGGAAAGFGLGVAGSIISTAVTMTAGNMNAVGNIMQANRMQFGGAGAMGQSGGFTSSQMGRVSGAVRSMGLDQPMTTAGEIRDILDQMAQGGLFQAAGDIGSITNRLGEALRAMKTIAVAAQTTLTEAVPIFQELRSAGFASPLNNRRHGSGDGCRSARWYFFWTTDAGRWFCSEPSHGRWISRTRSLCWSCYFGSTVWSGQTVRNYRRRAIPSSHYGYR